MRVHRSLALAAFATGAIASAAALTIDPTKHAIRRLVRDVPAEVDLGGYDAAAADGQHLGVAETLAVAGLGHVGDENLVPHCDDTDALEAGDLFAVGPAAREIGGAVELVVERAGEVEVFGDQLFQRRPVLFDVGLVTRAGDSFWIIVRHGGDYSLSVQARVGIWRHSAACFFAALPPPPQHLAPIRARIALLHARHVLRHASNLITPQRRRASALRSGLACQQQANHRASAPLGRRRAFSRPQMTDKAPTRGRLR
jgi:hypothetical protein